MLTGGYLHVIDPRQGAASRFSCKDDLPRRFPDQFNAWDFAHTATTTPPPASNSIPNFLAASKDRWTLDTLIRIPLRTQLQLSMARCLHPSAPSPASAMETLTSAVALLPDCLQTLFLSAVSLGVIHTDGSRSSIMRCTKLLLETVPSKKRKTGFPMLTKAPAAPALSKVQVTLTLGDSPAHGAQRRASHAGAPWPSVLAATTEVAVAHAAAADADASGGGQWPANAASVLSLSAAVEALGGTWDTTTVGHVVVAHTAAALGGEPCTFAAASVRLDTRGRYTTAPALPLAAPLPLWNALSASAWLPDGCLLPLTQEARVTGGIEHVPDSASAAVASLVACQTRMKAANAMPPHPTPSASKEITSHPLPVTLFCNVVTPKGAKGRRLVDATVATAHLASDLDEATAYRLAEAKFIHQSHKLPQVLDSIADVYAALVQAAAEGQYGGLQAVYELLPRSCMSRKAFENEECDVLDDVCYRVGR